MRLNKPTQEWSEIIVFESLVLPATPSILRVNTVIIGARRSKLYSRAKETTTRPIVSHTLLHPLEYLVCETVYPFVT